MNRKRNQLLTDFLLLLGLVMVAVTESVSAYAEDSSGKIELPNSGISTILSPTTLDIDVHEEPEVEEEELNITQKFEAEQERMMTSLAMANVGNTLNVRAEASEDSEKVGYLYKDCGGTILEQKDGWTKIQSGALAGWCSDEYLCFGKDALEMADDVGKYVVSLKSEAVRVRLEPSSDAEVIALLAKNDLADYVETVDNQWISIDYEGELGYVDTQYIDINFHIDSGETMEQVLTREKIEKKLKEEAEAKARTQNRGAVSADADELRLLGALIYCESGNQTYEGKLAVGAVVMNRVKSPAYPNTIYSVIYASGQFTPAMSGKVAAVYNGTVPDECLMAAQAAINGETTVGGATHFRRNNGREGYVLGDHVFW